MSFETIDFTVTTDRVAVLTLNRPDRLNAWSPRMATEVREVLHGVADDDGVRVVILTGAGRGFCAGADMQELSDVSGQGLAALDGTEDPETGVGIMTGIRTEAALDPDNRFGAAGLMPIRPRRENFLDGDNKNARLSVML